MRIAIVDERAGIAAARDAGAELIVMPHLSFHPYFPAARDRAALELAERAPSATYRSLLEAAAPAWLAASAYESEGEGVFYVSQHLGSADGGIAASYRQVRLDAAPGRYEQMFFSPGHTGFAVADTPWGPTGLLTGADVRGPDAYGELAERGARLVVGGASEGAEAWPRARRVAAGAAAGGLAVALANRGGGAAVLAPGGAAVEPGGDGLYTLELR